MLLMAHITLKNEQLPGIVGLLDYRPETARPLNELAEILLRGPSILTRAERELIASSVSHWNHCHFCPSAHGAAAGVHLKGDIALLDDIKAELKQTKVSPKLRALLNIAKQVQQGGRQVTEATVKAARRSEEHTSEIQ